MSEGGLRGRHILVTGGLGFIGQALTQVLLRAGARVRILDNLLPQVHGAHPQVPAPIAAACEVLIDDVRNREAVRAALQGVDGLVHLAAETGTGQSMYSASHHFHVNTLGTAMVLEEASIAESLRTLVLASSRAVYGEGAYRCKEHGLYSGVARRKADLARGLYDVRCPRCDEFGTFTATAEDAVLAPQSIYGITKYDLEKMTAMLVRRADQCAFVLRFQNVYGIGQSLINPYTGILAIFASLAKRNEEILIFEDGAETRDFVNVSDAVAAIVSALSSPVAGFQCVNVGTGAPTEVMEVARRIVAYFGSKSSIRLSGFARAGDIRHNVADMGQARKVLGFETQVTFEQGIEQFLGWARTQNLDAIAYRKSLDELERLGAVIRRAD
jgi:dTDP-L-rhamnose 4-epimerase